MAQQTINVGAAPNDGTGTPLRTAFQYTNSNFSELYTAVGPSGNNIVVPGSATITGDLTAGGDAYLNGNEKYVYLFSNYSIGNNSRVRFRAVGAGGGSGYGGDFRISTRATNNTWNTDVLTIDSSANCIWTDGAGGTRMTLNSTGLGVGVSPTNKFEVKVSPASASFDGLRVSDSTRVVLAGQTGATYSYLGIGANQNMIYASGGRLDVVSDSQLLYLRTGTSAYAVLDTAGNVGVGVTPSYKFHALVASGYSGAFKASTAAITGILIGNTVADLIVGVDASGNGRVTADTSKYLGLGSNGINDRATLDSAGNFVVGIAAVATTATDGFLYVTGCAGTPTGTPTAKTGRVPIVVDTTNNKLYFYSGGSWVAAN